MDKNKSVNVFFTLSLLLVFVVCSLFVIVFQINGYNRLVNANEKSSDISVPVSYISNKIKAYDAENAINVENIDGIDCLVLKSEQTVTYIYKYKDELCELYASKDYHPTLSAGDKVAAIKDLKMNRSGNLITIKVEADKQWRTLKITLRSEVD